MTLQTLLLAKAANQARGLAIDAVHACSSGHLGLPLGAAEIGTREIDGSEELGAAEVGAATTALAIDPCMVLTEYLCDSSVLHSVLHTGSLASSHARCAPSAS